MRAGNVVAAACLWLLLAAAAAGQDDGPMRVVTKDKEFSVLMPNRPAVHATGDYHLPGGVYVATRHVLHTYHGGVVFMAEIYEASDRKRLLKELLKANNRPQWPVLDEELSVGGYKGTQRTMRGEHYFGRFQYLLVGKRLYVLHAAARDDSAASALRATAPPTCASSPPPTDASPKTCSRDASA